MECSNGPAYSQAQPLTQALQFTLKSSTVLPSAVAIKPSVTQKGNSVETSELAILVRH